MAAVCTRNRSSRRLGTRSAANGHPYERKPRKPRLEKNAAYRQKIIARTIRCWVIGVILIELHFFRSSIRTLDLELEKKSLLDNNFYENENNGGGGEKRPPRPREPPAPKTSLLPRKVIAVFGPESSGTTFLATTLSVAVGAFTEDGGYFHTPAWAFSHVVHEDDEKAGDSARVHHAGHEDRNGNSRGHRKQYHPRGRWNYEREVRRRAISGDGEWEIQHLSLPWGWRCEKYAPTTTVEALVPEECFRYESEPNLHPKMAEKLWFATKERKHDHLSKSNDGTDIDVKNDTRREEGDDIHKEEDESPEEISNRARCREEVRIAEDSGMGPCGAMCGRDRHSGYALYPKRFSVNITSHIEWYLSRGIDIKVVLLMRDRTISRKSKLNGHCHLPNVGKMEDEVASSLMIEAMEKYGMNGSRRGSLPVDAIDEERVIATSYEGMMEMQEVYLYELYHQLGINSTYVPSFQDGNKKYVTNIPSLHSSHKESALRPPKPSKKYHPPPKKSLLPKKVIAIFGPESSGTKFLSSTLGVATGAFSSHGQWSHVPHKESTSWVYHEYNYRRAMSLDGEWEVQHLSLPWGGHCKDAGEMNVVEALVPEECFRYESSPGKHPETAEEMSDSTEKVSNWRKKRQHRSPSLQALLGLMHKDHGRELKVRKVQATSPISEMSDSQERAACRDEVHISVDKTPWTCGALCGEEQYNGFALYPQRFFVNITSHIEWYKSRGVEVTALLSMRDHSISQQSKRRERCSMQEMAQKEDELALLLMKEAMQKYGKRSSKGRPPRAIPVSYEGLMQFQETYLFDLYKLLGINSSYVPIFQDGNHKYVADDAHESSNNEASKNVKSRLSQAHILKQENTRKPKPSLLAKKVIAVFGLESSGTTFLSTTLGLAVGINCKNGVTRQVMSSDAEWEIHHLPLPWGWECERGQDIASVEALVPAECFRYESDPSIPAFGNAKKNWTPVPRRLNPFKEEKLLSMCRDEVKISDKKDNWTCGAMCGDGKYNGFALYPQRFFVNITSHIEWYLSRGVDIKVVVSMRDRTMSSKSKLDRHCHIADVGIRENELALSIVKEALEKYGKRGSRLVSLPGDTSGKERVIIVSYEGMMEMQEVYLHELYHQLGINSTYVPSFQDGNLKYIANNVIKEHQQQKKEQILDSRPPKPERYRRPPSKASLLPKKLVSVIDSSFLSTTLAVATGAFPSQGKWIDRMDSASYGTRSADGKLQNKHELVFEDSVRRGATVSNGDWEIQHISLPIGWKCTETNAHLIPEIVEALVPKKCFSGSPFKTLEDTQILEQCRNEVHISEDSKSWTCGAKCGTGKDNGYALYPESYIVNITSHIEWYLSRGVDITVVLSMRDRSISMHDMLKKDCPIIARAHEKNESSLGSVKYVSRKELVLEQKARHTVKFMTETALAIKKEAYKKYGKHGSLLKSGDKERVIAVSYEGLLELKDVYLFDLYHQLGINSSHLPTFIDGNAKYIKPFKSRNRVKSGWG